MKLPGLLILVALAGLLHAQTLRPVHVSPGGFILDDAGKPVLLRGLNRSATGSGNADATATDADYAAQNQLLSMNLVRIFVNTAWWTANTNVPIANMGYADYIDQLIQRAKKYGDYVLIVKAGQFPDPPCGADGKNCPAPNQGDLNCQANASVCTAQDTSGTYIFGALNFWAAFAKKYTADPAILYDTWEDMRGLDPDTWSNNENELIATIRTYSPQSVVFLEDTGTAFESIAAGTTPDLVWSNIVWNFHLYTASSGTCVEPASPRYLNWPQNADPLVTYAQAHGHAVAISEWGGCNDPEPYHTNITSYAKAHSIAIAYFDSGNVIANAQLTAVGTKVMQAYASIAAGGPGTVASINSASGATTLAPEIIAAAFGANLATSNQVASSTPLPVNLGGTSVQIKDVNGVSRAAQLFYAYPTQVAFEVPPGVAAGAAALTVSVNGDPVAFGTANVATVSPGLYTATSDGKGVASAIVVTVHADGTSGFAYTFQCASAGNCSAIPIDLGSNTDQVVLELYGTGIRGRTSTAGVVVKLGSTTLPAMYAGPQLIYPGLDQINILLPKTLRGAGSMNVSLTVDGQAANTVAVSFR